MELIQVSVALNVFAELSLNDKPGLFRRGVSVSTLNLLADMRVSNLGLLLLTVGLTRASLHLPGNKRASKTIELNLLHSGCNPH